jgi:transposase
VLERMVRGEVSNKALHTLLPWTWREAQAALAA